MEKHLAICEKCRKCFNDFKGIFETIAIKAMDALEPGLEEKILQKISVMDQSQRNLQLLWAKRMKVAGLLFLTWTMLFVGDNLVHAGFERSLWQLGNYLNLFTEIFTLIQAGLTVFSRLCINVLQQVQSYCFSVIFLFLCLSLGKIYTSGQLR